MPENGARRSLSRDESLSLPPGAGHYRAFVGPPTEYDLIGGAQFSLAFAAGLRETHRLLDFGCGSLRAGRLFMQYLLPERYFGVEPNEWLIQDAVAREVGADLVALKRPTFRFDDDFQLRFGVTFAYVIAQSVFSHAGAREVATSLTSFAEALEPSGLILATFVVREPQADTSARLDAGWRYPECVTYTSSEVCAFAEGAGLHARRLRWHHPMQTWFAFAREEARLPNL